MSIKSFINACFICSLIINTIGTLAMAGAVDFDIVNELIQKLELGHLAKVGVFIRVFFKTVPLLGIAFLIALQNLFHETSQKGRVFALIKMVSTGASIILSMTMGLWLGVAVGMIVILLMARKIKRQKLLFYGGIIGACALLVLGDFVIFIISSRFSANDISVSIKLNQVVVMLGQWVQAPIFGKGFGNLVIFDTKFGIREMLTIENSWLEILVTFGIFGFFVFCWFFGSLMLLSKRLFASANSSQNEKNSYVGILSGMSLLCVVTTFNPFIINPIGLGFIALASGILNRAVLLEQSQTMLKERQDES